jgi:spore coat protein U-like protein
MKTALKIAAGALAVSSLSALSHTASAQNVATGTATGSVTVVQPITITNTAGLQFGKLAQPGSAASVTITPAGTVTRTGVSGVGTQTTSAAAFSVGGDGAAVFAIASPSASFSMLAGTSGTIVVTTALSAATGTLSGTTGTAGTANFTVGGTMALAANQAAGAYTGTFDVTVTYN